MNEAETRAELIDPALKAAGWEVVDGSKSEGWSQLSGSAVAGPDFGTKDPGFIDDSSQLAHSSRELFHCPLLTVLLTVGEAASGREALSAKLDLYFSGSRHASGGSASFTMVNRRSFAKARRSAGAMSLIIQSGLSSMSSPPSSMATTAGSQPPSFFWASETAAVMSCPSRSRK